MCVCVSLCVCVCVCVCLSSLVCVVGLFLCTLMRYIGFMDFFFLCLIGCFSMIVWTSSVFECLICMRFLFLYLHLFSANEHVSHGEVLQKYTHYCYHYYYHIT